MTPCEREARIRDLFPLVRQIARRVACIARGADPGDLVGDGSIGLIRAVDTFDPTRGATLETYARRLIVGAMLNGMRRADTVSERARRTLRRADEKRFALAQERGTLPSFAELEHDDAALRRARAAAHRQTPLSLDAPMPRGHDPLVDWRSEPATLESERAKRDALAQALALLPERQRRIVSLHYGAELTLHSISARLRVSPQRVSQLHLRALTRLRHALPPA